MPNSEPSAVRRRRPRPWRWVFLSLGGTLLVASVSLWLLHVWRCHVAGQAVKAVEERLDATAPGWRFEDVLAARRTVPPGENSAEEFQAAVRLLPQPHKRTGAYQPTPDPDRVAFEALTAAFDDWPANVRFDAEMVGRLCRELVLADEALRQARRLAERPAGRFDVEWRVDTLNTLLPQLHQVPSVGRMLTLDAGFRADGGDLDGALVSLQASLNAGRPAGDEPTVLGSMIRVANATNTVHQLERVLAQGEPSGTDLTGLEQLLKREDEETIPDLGSGLRGERAMMHRMITGFDQGLITFEEAFGERKIANPSLRDRFTGVMVVPMMRHSLAVYLERLTLIVEAAGSPTTDWDERVAVVESLPRDETAILANLLMPAMGKIFEAARRKQALVRCAMTSLTAERFRREKGRWPERLDELCPAFVKEVPADPYDGASLRMKRTEDGLVIYSVGRDKVDNDGEFDRKDPTRLGADIGVRLWNVDRRGLPPEMADGRR